MRRPCYDRGQTWELHGQPLLLLHDSHDQVACLCLETGQLTFVDRFGLLIDALALEREPDLPRAWRRLA